MASIRTEPNERKSILVICPDRKRRTIRLSTQSDTIAREAAKRIQELSDVMRDGELPSRNTMLWLQSQNDKTRQRIENAGLIKVTAKEKAKRETEKLRKSEASKPKTQSLKQLTDRFRKGVANNKLSTHKTYDKIIRNLLTYFGADKIIQEITPQDATEFREWLKREGNIRSVKKADRGKKGIGKPMAENTVRRRTGLARQVFKIGIRAKWITENPFEGLAATFKKNATRDVYIPPETIVDCINAANNWEWRLIFALSGFAGLRGASEILTLRWDGIDFNKGAIGEMDVRSPKTEHHEGQESRVVPIFPDLLPYLREAEQMAEQIANDEGRVVEFVIDSYQGDWEGRNLNQQAKRIIERAGHGVIPKIFPNLRASGETDLIGSHDFDINDIAAWWGHSVEVALKHYSRRRDEHAKAALTRLEAKAEHGVQKTAHDSGTVATGNDQQASEPAHDSAHKTLETRDLPGKEWAMRDSNPRHPRCKRGALAN